MSGMESVDAFLHDLGIAKPAERRDDGLTVFTRRLTQILLRHQRRHPKDTLCGECGRPYPCPTRQLALGVNPDGCEP